MPGPQVCVGGCLRVTARGMGVGGRFPGRRGRRPLRVAREWAAAEACPSSGPAGPPSPKGEGKGCSGGIHPSRGVGGGGRSRRGGAPRPTDGDIKMLWGLRGQPFPGRRAVGAGHARPGGWREHPSMVRSVGRGLDPSAGVGGSGRLRGWLPGGRAAAGACPSSGPAGPPSPTGEGKGCCWRQRKPPRGVGDAAPYGLPGEGRQREPVPHPALRGHLPPRGKARAVVGGSGSRPLPRQLVLGAELEGQAVVPAV